MTDISDQAGTELRSEGWDVGALINEKLAPALAGEPVPIAIIAMLTFSLLLMKPEISVEDAEQGVIGASNFMMDYLALKEAPEHEKRLVDLN